MISRRFALRSFSLAATLVGTISFASPAALPGLPARAAEPVALAPASSDDDFATQMLADPWDMSGPEDIAFEQTRDTGHVTNLRFEDGMLVATSGDDARIFLQIPSNSLVNPVPGEGGHQPINADYYRYLTVRLYVPGAENDFVQAFWQANYSKGYGSTNAPAVGQIARDGWRTITLDLKDGAAPAMEPWAGEVQGLFIDPTLRPGVEFKIDFVRLSANPPSIPISLAGNGDLLISRAGKDDAERITRGFAGDYTWPVGLAAGSYEVYASSDPAAKETLLVDATPQFAITAPSYVSGPEFALEVRNNPWDMDDAGDIDRTQEVLGASFANSMYSATSTDLSGKIECMKHPVTGAPVYCGDPGLTLHWGYADKEADAKRIDPNRYKYLTYRMKLDGPIDTIRGSVGRLIWTSAGFEKSSASHSWVIYEGWQTVTFDLTTLKLEPGQDTSWSASRPWIFRFDPHEFPEPRTFHIDYVMLTGDDRADKSFDIRYEVEDAEGATVATQFFFTPTRGAKSGGTAITCTNPTVRTDTPAATGGIYLPMIANIGISKPVGPTGASCRWDTSALAAGTYYVYGVVSDGRNSRIASSETAVVVSH